MLTSSSEIQPHWNSDQAVDIAEKRIDFAIRPAFQTKLGMTIFFRSNKELWRSGCTAVLDIC